MPMARGTGTDLSPAAAGGGAGKPGPAGLAARARFRRPTGSTGCGAGAFDLIVSNPPYIAAAEMAALAPELRDWEPHLALTPGGDGLDAYRAIAAARRRG
jgi:release factor glutamine methyltransferase